MPRPSRHSAAAVPDSPDSLPDRPFWSVVLRALREARGITQEGWSAQLGVARSTLIRWERGEVPPDARAEEALIALCDAKSLFHTHEHGPLAGLTVTAAWLSDLLAGARLSSMPHRGPAAMVTTLVEGMADRSLQPRFTNLTVPPTTFIGRDEEVGAVASLLRRGDARLVTLTGPGGTGKTRLAIAVAAEVMRDFPDGVFVVALASITDPALVVPTIAQALGIKEGAGRPVWEMLLNELRTRRRLLVLDNFEQLLPAATIVGELLAACPGLHVLITSRATLHLSGEHEMAVPPLRLPARRPPPPIETLSQYAAAELFIIRATSVRADFAVTRANAPAVAEICHRLDGLPLAIELAAARCKVLTPQAMLARLDHGLDLLTEGPRDAPARQRTLRATIAWSYDLLTKDEQVLLRRLAVFVGGWTLDAATAVCTLDGNLGGDVLEGIASLVDKSLIAVAEGPDGEPRYSMLETIREYATERLVESGEAEVLRRQHAAHFLELVESAELQLWGAERFVWMARLTADHDNVRAALGWSRSNREPTGLPNEDAEVVYHRLAGALFWFWFFGGHWSEAREWLDGALRQSSDARPQHTWVRAKLLHAAGATAFSLGDYTTARSWSETSLAIARDLGEPRQIAWSLFNLGMLAMYTSDAVTARERFAESAARFREAGDPMIAALPLAMQGDATISADREAARDLYEESLAISRAAHDAWVSSLSLTSLGRMALEDGDYASARALCEEGLAARQEVGDKWMIAISLASLADVARCEGAHEQAANLFDESLALSRDVGAQPSIAWSLCGLSFVACRQGDFVRAAECLTRSLDVARTIGQQQRVAACLVGFAAVAAATHRWVRAVRLLSAAQALSESIGLPLEVPDRLDFDRIAMEARGAIDPPAFAAAWDEGRTLPRDQAVAEALTTVSDPRQSPAANALPNAPMSANPAGLTGREVEVLRLLALGKSNPAIAATLVLSVHTIERHVANLYAKIDAHSRAEATIYAVRRGLV